MSTAELPKDAGCRALLFFRDNGSWPGETDWADILSSSGSDEQKALVLRLDPRGSGPIPRSTDQANQAIEQLGCAALSG